MIELDSIAKNFGKNEVLSGISLTIEDGIVYGLIGHNGAGKTTLLKIIGGIYRPDGGTVRVDGAPVYENEAVKQRMFMMTEELFFLPQATLPDMARFYSGYYPAWNQSVYERLTRAFGLDPQQKISGFSKGMQRQAGLITAFASGARILLLDEAFDGLDLQMRHTMRQILQAYVRARSATAVLTTHNLQELEACVQRFGMIRDARLFCDKGVDEIHAEGKSLEEYFLNEKEETACDWEALFS